MHKYTRSFLVTLVLSIGLASFAQPGTSSPYSLSGLGELKYTGFVDHQMMGGVSRAYSSQTNYSIVNPASYASLKSVVYNAGASFSRGALSTDLISQEVSNGNFGYISLAFASPYEKKMPWGVSFGLHQLSDVGYSIRTINNDTFNSYNIFRGTGGLSTAYVGGAISPVKGLSVGLNLNYNFGNIQSIEAQVFPSTKDLFSFSDETYLYYRGFNLDLGVQYNIQKGKLSHTLGASIHTKSNLNGTGYRYSESFFGELFDQGQLIPIDTLLFDDGLENKTVKPQVFGVAYALSVPNKWTISAEYEKGLWSGVINDLNGQNYNDNEKYAIGFSWVPKPDYKTTGSFLKKINFSAGARYEKMYYNFFGQELEEVGISFGLGLPIVKTFQSKSGKVPMINRVNLGFEMTRRGTIQNDLIQEDYFTVRIGLNFSDKWFLKRKYQ